MAPLIDTEDGSKGDVIGNLQMAEMPLNGRTFSDLAYLVPGVADNAQGAMGAGFSMNPQSFALTHFQAGDTLTWVRSRHLLKFGGSVEHEEHYEPYITNCRGTFNFTGNWTGKPCADFMLGTMNNDSRLVGSITNYMLKTDSGFFAQDDWKVSPRLTLNLGLRYEIQRPITDKYDRWIISSRH